MEKIIASLGIVYILLMTTTTSALDKNYFKEAREQGWECGRVAVIDFGKDYLEVIIHPSDLPSPNKEGRNYSYKYKRSEFDLALVENAALAAMKDPAIYFCMNLSSKVKDRVFYLTR